LTLQLLRSCWIPTVTTICFTEANSHKSREGEDFLLYDVSIRVEEAPSCCAVLFAAAPAADVGEIVVGKQNNWLRRWRKAKFIGVINSGATPLPPTLS